jgi:hypothetical protein
MKRSRDLSLFHIIPLENDLKKKILVEKIPSDLRIKYLNALKIFIYLTVELTNHYEKMQKTSKDNDLLNGSNLKVN